MATKKKSEPKVKELKNDKKISVDDRISIKEMEDKIVKMKADKEAKCKAAKEQLVDMLKITVDKYYTATGTAEALRILRFVGGDGFHCTVQDACDLATRMGNEASMMAKKAEDLPCEKMDQLCDGFYEKTFKPFGGNDDRRDFIELAFEMMRIDLCRNVGGSAEDMVDFIKRVDQEIEDTEKALAELKGE